MSIFDKERADLEKVITRLKADKDVETLDVIRKLLNRMEHKQKQKIKVPELLKVFETSK